MVDTTKWRCTECGKIWLERELLSAPNPFNEDEQITGCPSCEQVNCFEEVCDWLGCTKTTSNGTPLDDGRYVRRCHDHRPEAMGETIKRFV